MNYRLFCLKSPQVLPTIILFPEQARPGSLPSCTFSQLLTRSQIHCLIFSLIELLLRATLGSSVNGQTSPAVWVSRSSQTCHDTQRTPCLIFIALILVAISCSINKTLSLPLELCSPGSIGFFSFLFHHCCEGHPPCPPGHWEGMEWKNFARFIDDEGKMNSVSRRKGRKGPFLFAEVFLALETHLVRT